MTGGFLGSIFATLSFTGALVAMISFFQAAQGPEIGRKTWRRMASVAWFVHVLSVFGVITTLFYLIYTHNYQYHYVWSHSSNELPVYYMISCFWEGQEGSFLLWTFWHTILGSVLYLTAKAWRDIVLSIVASVNLILASMILGVYVPEGIAKALFLLTLILPMAYLGMQLYRRSDSSGTKGFLHIGAIFSGLFALLITLTGKTGFMVDGLATVTSKDTSIGYTLAFFFVMLMLLGIILQSVLHIVKGEHKRLSTKELFAHLVLVALAISVMFADFGTWKIGSSPFLLLRDAFKNAPIFQNDPSFMPTNGKGLNSLLQNYWMVIHPPTLFLGFASTVVPFAFVIGGLIQGKYTEWVRPSSSWMIFSVAILGVGIIMGGYWAYETLNFGGYWNWDPVENGSLVPWILGIAALHGVVAYRKSKSFLPFTMAMIVSVFLMVLYSTFLTRSGILGETSVHTFTDLGLSGQLLALLFVYIFLIQALFVSRVNDFPKAGKGIPINSAEFMVFLGVLALLFSGLVITIFTSSPVFNKILGTHWAPVKDTSFFYYRWTVYFSIALAVLSGIGQFMYWRKIRKATRWNSLMRPYGLAIITAIAILFAIAIGTDWQFGLDDNMAEWKSMAETAPTASSAMLGYIRWAVFIFSDEIMLFSALFMVFANLDILVGLLLRNRRTRMVSGGSIAHAGFGLMLIGIFFSSGYDNVLTQNSNPNELAALPEDSRNDNVMLQKGRPRNIKDFQVTYIGKKEAKAPISALTIIQEDDASFKVRFADSTGDIFAFVLPRDVFSNSEGAIDLAVVETFLNDKMNFLKPSHINERTLYGLKFVPRTRNEKTNEDLLWEDKAFTVYPEAEINPTMGLLAHPSRKIYMNRDVYVHVSTVTKDDEEPEFKFYQFDMAIGDTVQTARAKIIFDHISSDSTAGTEYELIARAHLRILTDLGTSVLASPTYRIDKENRVSIKDHYLDDLYTSVAFVGVNTTNGQVAMQVQERQNPPDDIVVIQAISKPWINFLWLGTFVLTFGFGMAFVRRLRENATGKLENPEEGTGIASATEIEAEAAHAITTHDAAAGDA
jgi:cytochrome c-type biogenesis protein CcmF